MKYDVFISHASEDKEKVVRPLAKKLESLNLDVWLDECELTLGDSLRSKIEQGLSESRFGIVILSSAFFSKKWPISELNGLTSKESFGDKVILPIWHEITETEIRSKYPMLADKLAISTDEGLDKVASSIKQAVEKSNNQKSTPNQANTTNDTDLYHKIYIPSSKKITIIGAAGDVGKQVANQLIAQQILLPRDKLQLVETTSEFSLLKGLSLDYADAYASYLPIIEIINDPRKIDGDIIVMAAGTPNDSIREERSDLAKFNKSIFVKYAENVTLNKHAFVIVVSNPIELGVDIFGKSDNFERNKVFGIGAFHDTLRFRREIAKDLKIPRSHVNAYVVGTHSRHMIPLWSSLRILGKDDAELKEIKKRFTKTMGTHTDFVDEEIQKIRNMLCIDEKPSNEVLDYAMGTSPDIRIHLMPRILQHIGSKTIFSTTNAVIRLIQHITKGRNVLMPAQVLLKKEDNYFGINETVPFGVPVALTPMGWEAIEIDAPNDFEKYSIDNSVKRILSELDEWEDRSFD
ncbi:MAG: TIR domain-containing protein [Methylococcaceae bacterium]